METKIYKTASKLMLYKLLEMFAVPIFLVACGFIIWVFCTYPWTFFTTLVVGFAIFFYSLWMEAVEEAKACVENEDE